MQKIIPFLWFNRQTEEAVALYSSIFEDSRLVNLVRYPTGMSQEHMRRMEGQVLTAEFELAGQSFLAIDGGDDFSFTPAISLFCASDDAAETQRVWDALSADGKVLMPLDEYPFSKKYGWCNDRFGLSWQLYTGAHKQRITPALMFIGEQYGKADEAMEFYASRFPDSAIDPPARYPAGTPAEGKVLHGEFKLAGCQFMAMENDSKHDFSITPAISFYTECDTQAEINGFWDSLIEGGGKHIECGWLNDRFGVAWQIVPASLRDLNDGADEATVRSVMNAVMTMKKLDKAELEAAAQRAGSESS